MAIDFPNSPQVNDTFTSGSNTWYWTGSAWKISPYTFLYTGFLGSNFDGQGTVVQVGSKYYFRMPKAGTITGWSIVADGSSPTCTIDIWKIADGTSLPTVSNTITASAKPILSTGNAVRSTTLTGWTSTFNANDIFCVNVDACSVATKINIVLNTTWS